MDEKIYIFPEIECHPQVSKRKLNNLDQNGKNYLRIGNKSQFGGEDLKVEGAESYTPYKNGSPRLKQAIDFLLDYIIMKEGMNLCDGKQSERQNTEAPLTNIPKKV